MNIKKCLSIFLSCVMLAEPSMASAHQISKKIDNSKPSAVQFVKGKVSTCNDWLNANPKVKTGLKVVGIGAAIYVGLDVLRTAGGEIWFNCASHTIPGLDRIETGGDDIKKQEGLMWCWNACLQRMLNRYGVEKSQKEIYKGITDKLLVSPLKVRRVIGNVAICSSRKEFTERADDFKYFERRFLSKCVFNDEIKKYVENAVNNQYTYQTLYLPWDLVNLGFKDSSIVFSSNRSEQFYDLCGKLRKAIAKKNADDQRKVVLMTLCPKVASAHMITIEDTRNDKFIMGEPQSGTTVSLNKDEYFEGCDALICDKSQQKKYIHGMPISFIVKKGHEITDSEWNKMLGDVQTQS